MITSSALCMQHLHVKAATAVCAAYFKTNRKTGCFPNNNKKISGKGVAEPTQKGLPLKQS